MLGELSDLSSEVLSHHMASLHSKDNPQGSPALLLIQLLFTPHLLSNIWENERFECTFTLFSIKKTLGGLIKLSKNRTAVLQIPVRFSTLLKYIKTMCSIHYQSI